MRVFEIAQRLILEAVMREPFRDFGYLPNRRALADKYAKEWAHKLGVGVRTMYNAIMSPRGYLRMFPYARLRGVPVV